MVLSPFLITVHLCNSTCVPKQMEEGGGQMLYKLYKCAVQMCISWGFFHVSKGSFVLKHFAT